MQFLFHENLQVDVAFAFIISSILLWPSSSNAQSRLDSSLVNTTKYGIIPAFSFNAERGAYLAAQIQQFKYGEYAPFDQFTTINFSATSVGAFSVNYARDKVRTWDTDLRTNLNVLVSQNFGNTWLGIDSKHAFNRARFDSSEYYFYSSFSGNIGFSARNPFYMGEGISRKDMKYGLRVAFENPWGNEADSYLMEIRPTGIEGALLTLLETSVVFESRNNEFRALEGAFTEVGVKYAPPVISTQHLLQIYGEGRLYVPIVSGFPNVSLASRALVSHISGDFPYWFGPTLGGSHFLRGALYNRYRDANLVGYNIEFRTWLLDTKWKHVRLGFNLFHDGGSVSSNKNPLEITQNWVYSWGIGGVASLFSPDNILKFDYGITPEGRALYLGMGYAS